jgi:hypothetical protein
MAVFHQDTAHADDEVSGVDLFGTPFHTGSTGAAIPEGLFLIGNILSLGIKGFVDETPDIKMGGDNRNGTPSGTFSTLDTGE